MNLSEHVLTLAVIAVFIALLVVAARRRPGDWTLWAGRVLAILIAGASFGMTMSAGMPSTCAAAATPCA